MYRDFSSTWNKNYAAKFYLFYWNIYKLSLFGNYMYVQSNSRENCFIIILSAHIYIYTHYIPLYILVIYLYFMVFIFSQIIVLFHDLSLYLFYQSNYPAIHQPPPFHSFAFVHSFIRSFIRLEFILMRIFQFIYKSEIKVIVLGRW